MQPDVRHHQLAVTLHMHGAQSPICPESADRPLAIELIVQLDLVPPILQNSLSLLLQFSNAVDASVQGRGGQRCRYADLKNVIPFVGKSVDAE